MSSTDSSSPTRHSMGALTLAALGVVYGDIGTSPLYTVKEVFAPHTGVPLDAPHIVGADVGGHPQIRGPHPARRQPR